MNKILPFIGCLGLGLLASGPLQAEVLQLVAGSSQSVALVTGGDVLQWGRHGGFVPAPVFGLSRIKALAAGRDHVLALRVDGTVLAWGNNSSGQLGNGTAINTDNPTPVMDVIGAVAVAAAGDQSYILKNDGTVWAWGANKSGQLGDRTTYNRRGPVVVEGLVDVVAIAAGERVLIALRKDGGVCTTGQTLDCSAPYHSVVGVAAEAGGTYVLLRDGTVHPLGGGHCGSRLTHQDVIMDQVHAIVASTTHLLILRDDGTLWSCGGNAFGQLGDSTFEQRDYPIQLGGSLVGTTQMAAGEGHSLAANEGGVWSWGDNSAGQLGTGNTTSRSQPGPIWDGTGRLR